MHEIVKPIDIKTSEYVYLIRLDGLLKIGKTNCLLNRMASYITKRERDLEFLYIIKTNHALEMEQHILENIKLEPIQGREYFKATNEDIEDIIKITMSFVPPKAEPRTNPGHGRPIRFIAKMDAMGRLRIPKKQRDAKRIVAGMDFDVKIWQVEKEPST
jgi:hypothetical protein